MYNMNKMNYTCPICSIEPNSHSFSKIAEENGISTFYTCPSKATKYWDKEGIVTHYDGLLCENGDKQWLWIFDCDGFELKHSLEIQTAFGIIDLLTNKYGKTLQKIIVLNPTWHIHSMLYIIWPFLNNHIRSLIEMTNKK